MRDYCRGKSEQPQPDRLNANCEPILIRMTKNLKIHFRHLLVQSPINGNQEGGQKGIRLFLDEVPEYDLEIYFSIDQNLMAAKQPFKYARPFCYGTASSSRDLKKTVYVLDTAIRKGVEKQRRSGRHHIAP
eukprot:scaffold222_cov175-Amphora_coffeaeformis.AAC.13